MKFDFESIKSLKWWQHLIIIALTIVSYYFMMLFLNKMAPSDFHVPFAFRVSSLVYALIMSTCLVVILKNEWKKP
jgi:hypothetical protein